MGTRFAAKSALALCIAAACSATVMWPVGTAQAKPPAAKAAKQPIGVGTISGPQGSKVRAKLLKILRDSGSYEVTDAEDVKPGQPPETYQAMAQGIGADAIIVGTVSKAMNLTLSVYGANGARVDAVQVKGGSFPKLFKAIDNELEIAVADPLERSRGGAKAQPAAAAAPPTPAPAPPEKKKLAPGEAEDEEEPDVGDSPKGKDKKKPAAAPKAKGKAKSDELESEDLPAEPSESAEAPAESSSDSGSTPSDGEGHGLRPIELMAGVRAYNRKFAYTGYTQNLVPYNLTIAPELWIGARIYPGALWGNGLLSHIGIQGRFEYGLATSTEYSNKVAPGTPGLTAGSTIKATLKTRVSEYQFGLRGRIPFAAGELGISALFGNQSFTLAGDENPNRPPYAVVPDVHYNYIRTGLDARFYISKLIVGAQVGPRFLTSMKELDKGKVWFPYATGSGLDFGLLLGWQVLPWMHAVGGIDVVRYGFDFNNSPAVPTRRVIAGGATDTYLSAFLGVMANFDLSGGAGGGSASVATEAPEEEEKPKKASDEDEDEEKPKAKAKAPPPPPAKKAEKKPEKKPEKKKAAPSPPVEEEEEEDLE